MHCTEFVLHDAVHSVDYAVARCPPVCPSVRLSVTRRYSVAIAENIIKLISLSGSRHSSFSVPNGMAVFRRGGVFKKSQFLANILLYLGYATRQSYSYNGRLIVVQSHGASCGLSAIAELLVHSRLGCLSSTALSYLYS